MVVLLFFLIFLQTFLGLFTSLLKHNALVSYNIFLLDLFLIWAAFAENMLLTADQKTIKLIDLGLAREETLTEMMTAETGTYRWMAPEVSL